MNIPTEKLASQCFLENLQSFGNPMTEKEKYNLYNGLRALAQTVENIHSKLNTVEAQLNSIN